MQHDKCAQCDNPIDGCKATLLGTPLCLKCSNALAVVDEVLESVRAGCLSKPIKVPVSSHDRAVASLSMATAVRHHNEAIKRAFAWGDKNLPEGEPLPDPEELVWAKKVWGED